MKFSKILPAKFRKNEVKIPVVRLQGVIAAGGNSPFKQNLNLSAVASQLKQAFEMKKAPVVAISVNSPGGSPVQSRLIYSRIRELADKHDKKVLIFVEDVAASGGYMISLAGDEIIVDETSIVGSIGVVAATFGFDKAIAKLGVERRVYTAGKNKVGLDPFQPENKADIAHLKALQKDIHDVFIDMVKERRADKLDQKADLFNGLYWTGRTAVDLGLVDSLGHMSAVLKERYGDKSELVLMQTKRGLLGRAQPSVSVDMKGVGAELAQTLPESILDTSEQRSLWAKYGL
ncbi:MAG: S49 family peptidase [Nitratireductor sp.]